MTKDLHVIMHFNEKNTMIWAATRIDFNGNYKKLINRRYCIV